MPSIILPDGLSSGSFSSLRLSAILPMLAQISCASLVSMPREGREGMHYCLVG